MFIDKWKDIAFGSDFGGDFLSFLERIPADPLTLQDVFLYCDLEQYLLSPTLLEQRTDRNIWLFATDFKQYVHYEDAILALCAVVVESERNGSADLSVAYGSKRIKFHILKEELLLLHKALDEIYQHPGQFVLFEMCLPAEQEETLSVVKEICQELYVCINQKIS